MSIEQEKSHGLGPRKLSDSKVAGRRICRGAIRGAPRTQHSVRQQAGTAMEKTCICRDAVACKGLTSAFSMLEDARGGFVRLPRFEENPSSQYYVERNAQRAAYLRYLLPDHPVEKETKAKHVAMHHFHSRIVADLTPQRRFPKTLSQDDMDKLGMAKCQEDEVLDEQGLPTGFYCLCSDLPDCHGQE